MTVSICPTFSCNMRCSYCYLGRLRDQHDVLDLDVLAAQLQCISSAYPIDAINIFGGEVSLLEKAYIDMLYKHAYAYCQKISVTSNLHDISKLTCFPLLSTSFNFCRSDFQHILSTIASNPCRNFSLSIVVLDELAQMSPDMFFSAIPENVSSLQFQKYSSSIYSENALDVDSCLFDNVMIRYIEHYIKNKHQYHFHIANIKHICDALDGTFDPTMRSNMFILPTGQLAVLKFDGQHEYFCQFSTLHEYEALCTEEQQQYFKKCCICPYYKSCYAEHLNLNIRCSGSKQLLQHFQLMRTQLKYTIAQA